MNASDADDLWTAQCEVEGEQWLEQATDGDAVRELAKTHFGETGHPVAVYEGENLRYVVDDEWVLDWSGD